MDSRHWGGKFNTPEKEFMGQINKIYVDPFVHASCVMVCASVEEVAGALSDIGAIEPKTMQLVDNAIDRAASELV